MSPKIPKTQLIELLEEFDKDLDGEIRLIAVGGTAMTLLNLKTSTIDIDFDLSKSDYSVFDKTQKRIPHGFRIDLFEGGLIFTQQLPPDYVEKAVQMPYSFKKIKLLALAPLDIVVTKIGRLNERDRQDIKSCIEKKGVTKEQIEERAKQIEYVGHQETYLSNLKWVIQRFY